MHTVTRAVAAGPVSPVSTGPLFPSLVACLALPISAIAWRTPTQRPDASLASQTHFRKRGGSGSGLRDYPESHRYHVETCEMVANSATELFRESSNNPTFLQANDSLASFTCEGCGFRPISEQDRNGVDHWCTTQWAELAFM